jgi:putative transposase
MPRSIPVDDTLPAPDWLMPEELWKKLKPLLPPEKPKGANGRPQVPQRRIMNSIFYILRTGCQWNALPRCLGSGKTVHRTFQKWVAMGVFKEFWRLGLDEYDELKGIQWEWQSVDGAMTKAPLAERQLVPTRQIVPSPERRERC